MFDAKTAFYPLIYRGTASGFKDEIEFAARLVNDDYLAGAGSVQTIEGGGGNEVQVQRAYGQRAYHRVGLLHRGFLERHGQDGGNGKLLAIEASMRHGRSQCGADRGSII